MLILSLTLCCVGCGTKSTQLQEFNGEKFVMDTLIHITVFCENENQAKKALDEAFASFERINDLTNRFINQDKTTSIQSDVIKINQNAGSNSVKVTDDTLAIVERANHFSELSSGAFDVSVGPAMDLWGFGGNQHVPSQAQINNVLCLVDYKRIKIDHQQSTVFLSEPGMNMDLGGVAKGYATDQAVLALKKMGVKHAMINAGGNVYALGTKPDGSPWRVGVQNPRAEGIIAILSVQDAAVVTSGDYQRYFTQGGVRYHHILDPATGKQARDVMQTTIVCKSSMDADILSTTLFVMGAEQGFNLANKLEDIDVMFVSPDKQIVYSDTLTNRLEFTGEGGYQAIAE